MRKICAVVATLFFATSGMCGDLSTTPPGPGLGLECSLCGIHSAPKPQEPQKPVKADPIQNVERPQRMKDAWYFVSFGRNAGTHGPYSSKEICDSARQYVDDAERCFQEERIRPLE